MSASLLIPTINQFQVAHQAAYYHRRLLATAIMYRITSGVVPIDVGHGIPGSALLHSPDLWHTPPQPIRGLDGAAAQPFPIAGSLRQPDSNARQPSDAEWEELKPLLHTMYIKENMTLATVRKALRERRGLILRYSSFSIPDAWLS